MVLPRLCLFDNLAVAFGAGDFDFSLALWHTEDSLALLTAEIAVGLAVLPDFSFQCKPGFYATGETKICRPFLPAS